MLLVTRRDIVSYSSSTTRLSLANVDNNDLVRHLVSDHPVERTQTYYSSTVLADSRRFLPGGTRQVVAIAGSQRVAAGTTPSDRRQA
jgi:hypothetical protein